MASGGNIFDFDNPSHIEEMLKMLEDEEEHTIGKDFSDDVETDGEDNVETQNDNSNTEEEDESDVEQLSSNKSYFIGNTTKWYIAPGSKSDVEQLSSNKSYFIGNTTKWYIAPGSKRKQIAAHNLIMHLPGVIGTARNAKNPIECWSCLFTNDLLQCVVKYTNQCIEFINEKFAPDRDVKLLDLVELKAFLVLLYLAAAYTVSRQSLEGLWGANGDGIEKFSLVRNLKRFKFIVRCLRFEDRLTRAVRKREDRLSAVREVFTKFIQNCQRSDSLR
ncbi:Transposase IS4 [Popillia japonica]|uniref:Transposase IS4 n=1 Tax=Popillia japonica TaxID=7064 RepID=A0AAW1K2U5_POPJA